MNAYILQNKAATRRCDYRLELALLSFMDKLKQGLLYVDAAIEQVEREREREREREKAQARAAVCRCCY